MKIEYSTKTVELVKCISYIAHRIKRLNAMKKIVLIGDIVSSRKIAKREEAQKKLQRYFNLLNQRHKTLISPFTITLGDEFQALYKNSSDIFRDIWEILMVLYPVKVRFSIGIGELSTPVNKKQSIGMDGPAFYNARKGLIELKKTSCLINIITDTNLTDELAKHSLFLISQLAGKWKPTRLKILVMLYEGKSVKEISGKLKISDKAVYKNIDSGSLNLISAITNEIANKLNSLIKQ